MADISNSHPDVICVACCDIHYRKSDFSNYGQAINIIAPGTGIIGLPSHRADNHYKRRPRDGCSYASPAVAAVAAIVISTEKLNDDFSAVVGVRARLRANALRRVITGFGRLSTNTDLVNTGINNPQRQEDHGLPYYVSPLGSIFWRWP